VFFVTGERLVGADTDLLDDAYERSGGTTTLVSVAGTGASGTGQAASFTGNSSDGSKAFFQTGEKLVGSDTDGGFQDVYERSGGQTVLVSAPGVGASPPLAHAAFVAASDDGNRVFFTTSERLTSRDSDAFADAYERSGSETRLVSDEAGPPNGVPPETTITGGPSGRTADTTPSFTFTADDPGASFQCAVDGGHFFGCISGSALTTFAEGPHTVQVRAVDPLGNIEATPAERAFTVDTTPPQTTFSGGPEGLTNDPTPTFTFSAGEAGATFECKLDGGAFAACASGSPLAPQPDGPHTLQVRAVDDVGNVDDSPAQREFTVDATAPETTILSGPPALSDDATPEFTFASNEAEGSFTCKVDGVASACTSPTTVGPLADGAHTFTVEATDAAGNTDPTAASLSFTVQSALRPPPPGDAGVTLAATAARTQSVKKGVLTVAAGCGAEACDLVASGSVNVPGASAAKRLGLGGARGSAAAGRSATLKLKIPKKTLAGVKRALAKPKSARKVRASVKVTATDAAGNRTSRTVAIQLKR